MYKLRFLINFIPIPGRPCVILQAFPDPTEKPEYRSMVSTTRHILHHEGYKALFAGLVPRAGRIVCAVFILTGTRNTLVEMLHNRRTQAPVGIPI